VVKKAAGKHDCGEVAPLVVSGVQFLAYSDQLLKIKSARPKSTQLI
jgi:hypothetical protein